MREWREETATDPGPMELVGVVENFFEIPEGAAHEIGFYVRMTAPDDVPDEEFAVADDPGGVLAWIPLDAVAAYPVLPDSVAELLTVPRGEVRHFVRRGERDGIP